MLMVSAVRSPRTRSKLGDRHLLEELVAAVRPLAVLLHHLLEEVRDVGSLGVLGVPDVLAVVVPGLEGVVLHGDEVVGDVVEAGLTGGHGAPPEVSVFVGQSGTALFFLRKTAGNRFSPGAGRRTRRPCRRGWDGCPSGAPAGPPAAGRGRARRRWSAASGGAGRWRCPAPPAPGAPGC